MTSSQPTEQDMLGPLERRVMRELWQQGAQSVADVLEAVNRASDRVLAYTTVMTILVRLYRKGFVTREREGRHYRYAAAFGEEALGAEVGRRELRQLIERYGAAALAGFTADLAGPDADLAARLRTLANASTEG
jgi:predicted transcriptional regulator